VTILHTCTVCGALSDENRCDQHRADERPSTAERGYGRAHQRLRKTWEPKVAAGGVRCARGADCRYAEDGLGGVIHPGAEWDLGHDDHDRNRYTGPEHSACNRATKSRGRGRPAAERRNT
jgi:hypothetical protein